MNDKDFDLLCGLLLSVYSDTEYRVELEQLIDHCKRLRRKIKSLGIADPKSVLYYDKDMRSLYFLIQ